MSLPPLDLTAPEVALFEAFLAATACFAGFGATAMICRAAALASRSVVALDGSAERIEAVRAECRRHADWTQPHLIHVDIGPTNPLGHPTDPATHEKWQTYPRRLWSVPCIGETDLFLIGGRFRVACAIQTLLHCRPDTVILFQTYQARREYHGFARFAREVARADALTAFVRRADFDAGPAHAMLERFTLVTT